MMTRQVELQAIAPLVEPRRLIVDDAPPVLGLRYHHAEEHADDMPIWEGEVSADVSEHLVCAQPAGLQDLVVHRHARWLARVILDDALAADAVRAQALEDGVLAEDFGDP